MITPADIKQFYTSRLATFEILRDQLKRTLSVYSDDNGYAFSIRIKTIESLIDKIHTGRYMSIVDIDDMVACSIVIPTLSDLNEVVSYLEKSYRKVSLKRRGDTLKSPDHFRYDSTRFIGKLKIPPGLDSHHNPIYDILFEVQVRTAFEYAWSTATHKLTYKTDELTWEKLRLTAQIKATVEQLDMLISGFDDVNRFVTSSRWPKIEVLKSIAELLVEKFGDGSIPIILKPSSISRTSENIYNLLIQSSRVHPKKHAKQARDIKDILTGIIEKQKTNNWPLSITLFQTIMGETFTDEPDLIDKYKLQSLITRESLDLYPILEKVIKKFKM